MRQNEIVKRHTRLPGNREHLSQRKDIIMLTKTLLGSLIAVFASASVLAAETPAPAASAPAAATKAVPAAKHVKKAPAKHVAKTHAKKAAKTMPKAEASAPAAK